jgi:hypothetical protein
VGLDVSHDAFSGAYSAFNRFRKKVAQAMGGSYPPHDDKSLDSELVYFGNNYKTETHPGLAEFLSHSDCDGEISPEMCRKVADELEALLPAIESLSEPDGGHIGRDGGYAAVTRRFITGCREAAEVNEPLEFH